MKINKQKSKLAVLGIILLILFAPVFMLINSAIISAQDEEQLQTLISICGGDTKDIAMNFAPAELQAVTQAAQIAACAQTLDCVTSLAAGQVKTLAVAEVLSNLDPKFKAAVEVFKQVKGYSETAVKIGDDCLKVNSRGDVTNGKINFKEETDASTILGLGEGIEAKVNNAEIEKQKGWDFSLVHLEKEGFYQIKFEDETGTEKTRSYDGMETGFLKVGKDGQIAEADFFAKDEEVYDPETEVYSSKKYEYTFGDNEPVTVPGGSHVNYRDGEISVNSDNSIGYLGRAIDSDGEIHISGNKLVGDEFDFGKGRSAFAPIWIDGKEIKGSVSIENNGLLLHENSGLIDKENDIRIFTDDSKILYADSDAFDINTAKKYEHDIVWQSGKDVVIKSREDEVSVAFSHALEKKKIIIDDKSTLTISNGAGELRFDKGKVYDLLYKNKDKTQKEESAAASPVQIDVENDMGEKEYGINADENGEIEACSSGGAENLIGQVIKITGFASNADACATKVIVNLDNAIKFSINKDNPRAGKVYDSTEKKWIEVVQLKSGEWVNTQGKTDLFLKDITKREVYVLSSDGKKAVLIGYQTKKPSDKDYGAIQPYTGYEEAVKTIQIPEQPITPAPAAEKEVKLNVAFEGKVEGTSGASRAALSNNLEYLRTMGRIPEESSKVLQKWLMGVKLTESDLAILERDRVQLLHERIFFNKVLEKSQITPGIVPVASVRG